MIYILHDLQDPKVWELLYLPYVGCNAGLRSSTVPLWLPLVGYFAPGGLALPLKNP